MGLSFLKNQNTLEHNIFYSFTKNFMVNPVMIRMLDIVDNSDEISSPIFTIIVTKKLI